VAWFLLYFTQHCDHVDVIMASDLIAVVLHLGQSKLEAVVDDGTGMRRRINLSWVNRKSGDLPPESWFDQIEGEVSYQKGNSGDPLARLLGGGGGLLG
jgi:hypothetical protein